MTEQTTQTRYEENGQATLTIEDTRAYAPAPRPDCHCPADAPCRMSGICTCALTLDLKKLKVQRGDGKNARN